MQTLEVTTPTSPLKAFFKALDYKLLTISVQPEKPGAQVIKGNWFDPKNRVRAIPIETFFTEEVQEELQNLQSLGNAIYFLINEGNGTPTDLATQNLNCGKRANITTLRTLAIDTDSADKDALMLKLKEIKLAPHYIIESSPNKYHFYFFINPEKTEGSNVLYWESLQRLLFNLVPNLDQSMADTNQVLRVPTFYNLKPKLEKDFQVRFRGIADRIEPYDLKFLYDRLGASRYEKLKDTPLNGNGTYTDSFNKFEFPTTKLAEGNRRTIICSYIEHLMENRLPLHASQAEYFTHVDSFIYAHLKQSDWPDFLPGGRRRQNLENYFRDQLSYRVKKIQAKETFIANQTFTHRENIEEKKLPNDFYRNFPGDLGTIVREISDYSPNLPQEICFAGALAISGALKAETFRFKGAWPFVNGLIIAGTGVGKSAVKDIVERALTVAGLRGKYPQILGFQNSVQSLHTALYAAGGAGTVIIDESGDYLSTITGKNAPGYAKALKKYFKEATTGKDQGTWLHPGGSLSYSVPPINGGMLSLWMLIQPDKFTSSLDLADMADGFLPRFFVFNGKASIKLTRTFDENVDYKSYSPSMDFKVYLESLVSRMPCIDTKAVSDNAEKELKELSPKAKSDVIAASKRDAVYVARSEARKIGANNVQVTITEEAEALVKDYLKEKEIEANKAQKQDSDAPALGVFIRMEEMLLRLMCNAASYNHSTGQAQVNKDLAAACIRFHRFQTDRFFENELAEISKGSGERDLEIVYKGLVKAYIDNFNKPVKAGQVSHAIKNTKRPKNVSMVIQELVKRGQALVQMQPNKKFEGHKTAHYIPLEEDVNEL